MDAKNRRICVSISLLQEQTRKIAFSLNNGTFKASNGWLESLRKRHNISTG